MNTNGVDETMSINGIAYVGLATYANVNGMDTKRLRRYVRNNADTLSVRKWGNTWLVERDCEIVIPETKKRGKQRIDGRKRYVVYVAPCVDGMHDELQRIMDVVGADNVVDPRERAKKRRIDKLNAPVGVMAVTE